MSIDTVVARLCAGDLVPPSVFRQVGNRPGFLNSIARYGAMGDDDIYRATEVCLRNLERLDRADEYALRPDARLRNVLVPELWERLRPRSRDGLRRISTSLAEYVPNPDSFWRKSQHWSAESEACLRDAADKLREDIAQTTKINALALVEQTRFAIAGSHAADKWAPDCPVYEPGFVFRLVPVIAWRVRVRARAGSI